jgi:hypothetical protein
VRPRTPIGGDVEQRGIREKKRKFKVRFLAGREKTAQKRTITHRVAEKREGRRTIANKGKKTIFTI